MMEMALEKSRTSKEKKKALKTENMTEVSDSYIPELCEWDGTSDEEDGFRLKDKPSAAATAAQRWLILGPESRQKDHRVIKLKAMGPFLFGQCYIFKKWKKWALDADLYHKDWKQSHGERSKEDMKLVDLMEAAIDKVLEKIVTKNTLAKLIEVVEKFEKLEECRLKHLLTIAYQNKLFHQWREELEHVEGTVNQLLMAVILASWHYVSHVKCCLNEERSLWREFADEQTKCEKMIEDTRQQGNRLFTAQDYKGAAENYTQAIEQSPFSHILYSNRAQTYLNLGNFRSALCDGRRTVILKPDFLKGYYRYAQALFESSYLLEAMEINKFARMRFENDKDLKNQWDKFHIILSDKNVPVKGPSLETDEISPDNDSDVPGLVDSSGESEFSDEDEDEDDSIEEDSSPGEEVDIANLRYLSDDEGMPNLEEEEVQMPELVTERPTEESVHIKEILKQVEVGKVTDMGGILLDQVNKKMSPLPKEPKAKEVLEIAKHADEKGVKSTPQMSSKPVTDMRNGKTAKKPLGTQQEQQKTEKREPAGKMEQIQKQKTERLELEGHMQEASHALLNKHFKIAILTYRKAFHRMTTIDLAKFGYEEVDLILIRYSLGTACVDTGEHQEILEGIAQFEGIIQTCKKKRFPLAYLGLGKAYHRQNRFEQALEPLTQGLSVVKGEGSNEVYHWPGTKAMIEDSLPGNLQVALEKYIDLCKKPAPPDAVCRYHTCEGHFKIQIYLSDPDFKNQPELRNVDHVNMQLWKLKQCDPIEEIKNGFVRVICFYKCVIEYHPNCWKKLKSELGCSDKDMQNSKCLTPDCNAGKWKIVVYDKRGEIVSEWEGKQPKGKHSKEKRPNKSSPSQRKAKSRQEKKVLRKQRKKEEYERKLAEEQEVETETVRVVNVQEEDKENLMAGGNVEEPSPVTKSPTSLTKLATVLRKEEDTSERYKMKSESKTKSKKKRDRMKMVMTLDEFVGQPESVERQEPGAVASINDIDHEAETEPSLSNKSDPVPRNEVTYYPKLDSLEPFSVPELIRYEVEAFEQRWQSNISGRGHGIKERGPDLQDLDIKETLFSFFAGILQEHGPLGLDDPIFTRERAEFPPEAEELVNNCGGLGKFLIQSLQFALIEDVVCLMPDAVKARQLSEERKKQRREAQKETLENSNKPTVATSMYSSHGISVVTTLPFTSPTNSLLYSHADLSSVHSPLVQLNQSAVDTDRPSSRTGLSLGSIASVIVGSSKSVDSSDEARSSPGLVRSRSMSQDSSASSNLMPSTHVPDTNQSTSELDIHSVPVNSMGLDSISLHNETPSTDIPVIDSLSKGYASPALGQIGPELNYAFSSSIPASPIRSLSPFSTRRSSIASDLSAGSKVGEATLPPLPTGTVWGNKGVEGSPAMPSVSVLENLANADSAAFAKDFLDASRAVDQPSTPDKDPDAMSFPSATGLTPQFIVPYGPPGLVENATMPPYLMGGSPLQSAGSRPDQPFVMPTANVQVSDSGSSLIPGFFGLPHVADKYFPDKLGAWSAGGGDGVPDDLVYKMENCDKELKQEIAESVMKLLSKHAAFADSPDLMKNVLTDIEQDIYQSQWRKPESKTEEKPAGKANGRVLSRDESYLGRSEPQERTVFMLDRAVNTDPYEDSALQAERESHRAQLDVVMGSYAQLESASAKETQELTKVLEDQQQQNQMLNNDYHSLEQELECDRQNFNQLNMAAQEEIQFLKQKVMSYETLQDDLNKKLAEQVRRDSDSARRLQEGRDKLSEEKSKHHETAQKFLQEQTRAQEAEVALLQLKLDLSMQVLERSLKDAEVYYNKHSATIKRYQNEKMTMPPQLRTFCDQWKATCTKIKEMQKVSRGAFEQQIEMLKQGKPLSQLPELAIPRPPPAPEFPVLPVVTSVSDWAAPLRSSTPPVQSKRRGLTPPPGLGNPQQFPALATNHGANGGVKLKLPLGGASAQATPKSASSTPRSSPVILKQQKGALAAKVTKRNSFEKIMDSLTKLFPNYDRSQLTQFIQDLRDSRNGSLSGMTLDEIVGRVTELIVDSQWERTSKAGKRPTMAHDISEVSKLDLANPWSVLRTGSPSSTDTNSELFDEEDPCVICHEEMYPENTTALEKCQHRFHADCIRKWLKEQSTCPTCRLHVLLPDEFPAL